MSARPQQGNFVRVRSRLYLVDQVDEPAERTPIEAPDDPRRGDRA